MNNINFAKFVPRFDAILSRGLSSGLGQKDGQMCIEAAVCAALDLPHGDNPPCVEAVVRSFKIALNDASSWPSTKARAEGLRNLGIAQVGSKGVVDGTQFATRLAELTIRILIPKLFRQAFPDNKACLDAADLCEKEGSADAARAAAADAWAAARADARADARAVAWAADAADAVARAADAAAAADRAAAADAADAAADRADAAAAWAAAAADRAADAAAAWAAADARAAAWAAADARAAAWAAADADAYLVLSANLALQVLTELKSPGVAFI